MRPKKKIGSAFIGLNIGADLAATLEAESRRTNKTKSKIGREIIEAGLARRKSIKKGKA